MTENGEAHLTGCFTGLRVLDFSTTIVGPHCARMLADVGAEVIKIEAAEGETMRTRPPVRNGCSTVFGQLNVGKKSLVLDLKSPEGLDAVRRLVARTDIVVENFRPGVMRRLKLDYDSLRPLNDKLIYCSISGYGQTGPYRDRPGYDVVAQGESGIVDLTGEPDRQPVKVGASIADIVAGLYA